MKKLWLSAIAATCLLAGNAAHAGDHGHHGDHDDWDRGHREYRHCDDDDRGRHWGWRDRPHFFPVVYTRPVYYQRPVYYERPAYYERPVYEERPAYYGNAYGDRDGEIHGSVSVGF